MARGRLIAANWKMHKTLAESREFISALELRLPADIQARGVTVLVIPPFTALTEARKTANQVKIGAQNMFFEDQGAFTGEISPLMLKGLADYVLIGHSERRGIFAENDDLVSKKTQAALRHGLIPILCVGETLQEREKGETETKVRRQLDKGLNGLSANDLSRLVLAYEPVWAIGTGRNATPAQAQEVHRLIRSHLAGRASQAEALPILYGGSVKPENSRELLAQADVDGLLIGGASLNLESFSAIIGYTLSVDKK